MISEGMSFGPVIALIRERILHYSYSVPFPIFSVMAMAVSHGSAGKM